MQELHQSRVWPVSPAIKADCNRTSNCMRQSRGYVYTPTVTEPVTLKKLQRLQNSNIRLCLSLPPLTRTNDIHRLANLNLLEDRRNAHLLNQMYKRSRNSEYADNRNLPLRSFTAPILKVPNFQKYRSKQSVIYRGSTNWNLLPPPLRSLPSYEVFKHKQKVLMLTLLT